MARPSKQDPEEKKKKNTGEKIEEKRPKKKKATKIQIAISRATVVVSKEKDRREKTKLRSAVLPTAVSANIYRLLADILLGEKDGWRVTVLSRSPLPPKVGRFVKRPFRLPLPLLITRIGFALRA